MHVNAHHVFHWWSRRWSVTFLAASYKFAKRHALPTPRQQCSGRCVYSRCERLCFGESSGQRDLEGCFGECWFSNDLWSCQIQDPRVTERNVSACRRAIPFFAFLLKERYTMSMSTDCFDHHWRAHLEGSSVGWVSNHWTEHLRNCGFPCVHLYVSEVNQGIDGRCIEGLIGGWLGGQFWVSWGWFLGLI